jgi:hypothetical protein
MWTIYHDLNLRQCLSETVISISNCFKVLVLFNLLGSWNPFARVPRPDNKVATHIS